MTTKGYNYPKKIKIALAKIFSWFGILIISHLGRFVNMFIEIFKITFREVEKEPPFYTREAFLFMHDLSIFLTTTDLIKDIKTIHYNTCL